MSVLSGEIDGITVRAFEARSRYPVQTPSPAKAVTAVTFIDRRGLCFLVRCTQTARASGRRRILRGPPRHLQRVLGLTGLAALFDTAPHRS